MKNSNNSIKLFIREISIVVIGILIALFINNWNEDMKHKKFIDKALYAIGEEIKYSKNDIESILPKHHKTISLLDSSKENNKESIKDVLEKIGGLQIPEIKNIGLRFFVSNSAELVDYEIISDLSEIEFVNKTFEMKLSKLTDLIYSKMDSTEKQSKEKVANMLIELTVSEKDLAKLYEEFLLKNEVSLQQSKK